MEVVIARGSRGSLYRRGNCGAAVHLEVTTDEELARHDGRDGWREDRQVSKQRGSSRVTGMLEREEKRRRKRGRRREKKDESR